MVATRENAPLLRERSHSGKSNSLNGSFDTLTRSSSKDDDEEFEDGSKPNQSVSNTRGLLIIFSLWGLIFLQASNMSGITTTQSKIAEDLDAFDSASWFTSAYLIAMSSTSPLIARLAVIFSPRYCVLVASIFFAIGGIIASQAAALRIFLLGRAFQGVGGAGILTISFILVLELAEKKRRGLFIGLVNTFFTVGVSFGAVVAGALVETMGWRFLFWIQTPLALIFGIAIFFSIPSSFTGGDSGDGKSSISSKLARIDYLGALTLTLSLSLFLFGLAWPKVIWTPIAVSIVLLVAFVLIELYVVAEPIIPVTVLKSRGALLSCFAQLGVMSARWIILFSSPAYAIAILAWSPSAAGSILLPTNFGFAVGGLSVGIFHVKRGGSFWLPSIISYFFFACTLFLLSQIVNATTPPVHIFISVFLNGLCTGASLNYTLAHLLHLTPPSTHFISTSLLTTFRGFAGSFGSAVGGGIFIRSLKKQLEAGFAANGGLEGREELVRKLLGSPALVKTLEGTEREVAVRGYVGGLKTIFLAGAGLALCMVLVQAATGWENGQEKERKSVGEETSLLSGDEWEEGLEEGA